MKRAFAGFLSALFVIGSAQANPGDVAGEILALMTGRPALSTVLLEEGHAPMKVQRKANAKIAWLNLPVLRELYFATYGRELPFSEITPELEKLVLDGLAYASQLPFEKASDYTSSEREIFADRYGGMGTGAIGSQGSGRAASAAHVQIKGVGRTPLANPPGSPHHTDGFLGLRSALIEAFWSEYMDRELPWGANKTLAVIDLGSNKEGENRALYVRIDPLRPAHLFYNKSAPKELEQRRLEANWSRWKLFLPKPRTAKGDYTLAQSLNEFAERGAEQYAAMVARRLYHGNLSAGNMLLNGGSIDLSSMTSQSGFAPITWFQQELAFGEGERESMKDVILSGLHKNCRRYAPAEIASRLPKIADLRAHFDKAYDRALRTEMLGLTGYPKELITKVVNETTARHLGDTLIELSRAGSGHTNLWYQHSTQETEGTYRLFDILTRAASFTPASAKEVESSIGELIIDPVLRGRFAMNYFGFVRSIAPLAKSEGYTEAGLATYAKLQAKLLNEKQPDLDFRKVDAEIHHVEAEHKKGNKEAAYEWMEKKLREERGVYKELAPGVVVIAEGAPEEGTLRRRVIFDAKADKIYLEIQRQGEIAKIDAKYGSKVLSFEPTIEGGVSTFRIPLDSEMRVPLFQKDGQWVESSSFQSKRLKRLRTDLLAFRASTALTCKRLFAR